MDLVWVGIEWRDFGAVGEEHVSASEERTGLKGKRRREGGREARVSSERQPSLVSQVVELVHAWIRAYIRSTSSVPSLPELTETYF